MTYMIWNTGLITFWTKRLLAVIALDIALGSQQWQNCTTLWTETRFIWERRHILKNLLSRLLPIYLTSPPCSHNCEHHLTHAEPRQPTVTILDGLWLLPPSSQHWYMRGKRWLIATNWPWITGSIVWNRTVKNAVVRGRWPLIQSSAEGMSLDVSYL
jgi:hypothetical protein